MVFVTDEYTLLNFLNSLVHQEIVGDVATTMPAFPRLRLGEQEHHANHRCWLLKPAKLAEFPLMGMGPPGFEPGSRAPKARSIPG